MHSRFESRSRICISGLLVVNMLTHHSSPDPVRIRFAFWIYNPHFNLASTQPNPNTVGDNTRVESPVIESGILWILPEDTARLGPMNSETSSYAPSGLETPESAFSSLHLSSSGSSTIGLSSDLDVNHLVVQTGAFLVCHCQDPR
jgi:hypothetical protein